MARSVGVVVILVVMATAVAGIVVTTRAARLFATLETQVGGALAAELDGRLRAIVRQLVSDLAGAEEEDGWSALQEELPRLAAADPTLARIAISDAEGLVVADSDPARNGAPLDEPALLALVRKVEPAEQPTDVPLRVGSPARVLLRRVTDGDGRTRVILVVASPHVARRLIDSLESLHGEAVRSGWILVGLGGLVGLVVAVAAALLAGSSIARRLRVVAWRVAQLGRSDRATHVRLDGPTEMQQVGRELELAAERLAVSGEASLGEERQRAQLRCRHAIAQDAVGSSRLVGHVRLELTTPGEGGGGQAIAAMRRGDDSVVVLVIERLGGELADAIVPVELRSAALALLAADGSMTPARLLTHLDPLVAANRCARVLAMSFSRSDNGRCTLAIANAGARFPVLRRPQTDQPVVIRGDRLGEAGAPPRAEVTLKLDANDAIVVTTEGLPVAGNPPLSVTLSLAADA